MSTVIRRGVTPQERAMQDNAIAQAQHGVSIAKGAFFQVGETLYLATDSIATGETVAAGQNCREISVVEALNLLREQKGA